MNVLDTIAMRIHALCVWEKYICGGSRPPASGALHRKKGLRRLARKAVHSEPCGGFRLQWLDTFVRLARTRNQPAVAREIGGSQATVSRQIAALESWLGWWLVTGAAPVRLTDDGERFASIAAEMLAQLESFRADQASVQPSPPRASGKGIVI